jgi:hypothetical protein
LISTLFRYKVHTYRFDWEKFNHRFIINRPTKRGKEKSSSDGRCQCGKEMEDHLLACQQFLKESHVVTRIGNERASCLKINDINDIFCGTSDCYHCCSIV